MEQKQQSQKLNARTEADRIIKETMKSLMALDEVINLYQGAINDLTKENEMLKAEINKLKSNEKPIDKEIQ